MAYYRVCPGCGASLGPGEHCDCRQEERAARDRFMRNVKADPRTGQLSFVFGRRDGGYVAKDAG